MTTYAQMPPEAEEVLRTVRRWTEHTGRGPRLTTLLCVTPGHPRATRRGLAWLKRRRLVSWTPDGSGTRYVPSEVSRG